MKNSKINGLTIAREKKGLTKLKLAALLNIDVSVINMWEAGVAVIPIPDLIKINSILGVSSDLILFCESRKPLNISNLTDKHRQFVIDLYRDIKKNKEGD